MSEEELSELAKINEQKREEQELANQEAYYWHVLMEFHAMLKVFGHAKILGDLKKIKEQVDGVVEKPDEWAPRIILP